MYVKEIDDLLKELDEYDDLPSEELFTLPREEELEESELFY
jgi:hypothetical protein